MLIGDGEPHDAVRIGEEHRLFDRDLTRLPIGKKDVEHQHGVGRVELVAEAIVGEEQETILAQRAHAGETLQRLAGERTAEAGIGVDDAIGRFAALATGEPARNVEAGGRIGRSGKEGLRRNLGVLDEKRGEFLRVLRLRGSADSKNGNDGQQRLPDHLGLLTGGYGSGFRPRHMTARLPLRDGSMSV